MLLEHRIILNEAKIKHAISVLFQVKQGSLLHWLAYCANSLQMHKHPHHIPKPHNVIAPVHIGAYIRFWYCGFLWHCGKLAADLTKWSLHHHSSTSILRLRSERFWSINLRKYSCTQIADRLDSRSRLFWTSCFITVSDVDPAKRFWAWTYCKIYCQPRNILNCTRTQCHSSHVRVILIPSVLQIWNVRYFHPGVHLILRILFFKLNISQSYYYAVKYQPMIIGN